MGAGSDFITYMIVICVILLGFMLFANPLKAARRFLLNLTMGCLCVMVANSILASWGMLVGINPLTVAVTGILGIPGVILLYVSNFIL